MQTDDETSNARSLVELDADHPGFRDEDYRARRDQIARIALAHRPGDPVPDAPYTTEEQDVWKAIWGRLGPLHASLVCGELQRLQVELGLERGDIPQLAALNRLLEPRTGFCMEPVAGLVLARDFLLSLGRGVFLSTQYIRHASRPFYTPEPDVVHETVGHAASLIHPGIAELSRAFGRAASGAETNRLERLINVYWYSLEFGLLEEDGELRALGAGLLSSVGELAQVRDGPRLLPWDLERMAATDFDPTDFQPALFVAPSLEVLVGDVGDWLAD